jgi:hypothetical protein
MYFLFGLGKHFVLKRQAFRTESKAFIFMVSADALC